MTQNNTSVNSKRTLLCFSSLLLLQVFFCAQYDSIYDPKSNHEYSFTINGIDTSSVFSIFQTYTLNLDDSAGYHRYYNFSCVTEKENVAHITQNGNNTFHIFFYKACTTLIHVNGIRYNENSDTKQFTVRVVNPYSIAGRDTFAKNEICSLLIKNSSSVNEGIPEKQIQWSAGSFTNKTNANSFFTFKWNETFQDTIIEIAADLVYDSIIQYPLGKKRIVFKGWAPLIRNVNIDFSSENIQQQLYQAEPFKVHLKINDPDESPYLLIVKDKYGTLIDSIHVNPFDSNCTLNLPGMKNHGPEEELRIQITDADGFQYSIIRNVDVLQVKPQVFIRDTLEIAFNNSYIFKIDSFVNSSKFHWKLVLRNSVIGDTVTMDDHLRIPSLNVIDTFLLEVRPEGAAEQYGDRDYCAIITKEYNYQTAFKNTDYDTLFVKVNRQDTLYTRLMKNDTIITDNGIAYRWTTQSGTASSYITINNPLKDSLAIFNFREILPPFKIEVKGTYGNADASVAQLIIKTMSFSPIFSLTSKSLERTVNIPFFPEFSIKITDPKSSPVAQIYYKIPQVSAIPSVYDTASGVRFNSTGIFTLIMWCVDSDGSVSNYDTAEVTTSSDLPYIKLMSDKIIVPVNRKVTITGDTACAGKTAVPIDSILLDINNDNAWDSSITPGANDEILIMLPEYPQPTLDTITIACKDREGNVSISVKKIIHVYSEIPRINNCVRKDTSTIYTGKKVLFNCSITDPDDSILTLKVFSNGSPFKTLSAGRQDTFSLQFKSAGTYQIALLAQDDSGHVSDTFLLSAPLIVDEGRPVVKSLTIKNRTNTFINDTVHFQISGIDYNGNVIEYQYYLNDTLSTPVIKNTSTSFIEPFKNSGNQIIYVRVMDNDSLFSAFRKDSITVRAGLPVVRSISVDTATFFAGSTPSFTISMADTNGTIKKLQVSWNGDTAALHTFTNEDTLKNSTQRVQYPSDRTDTGAVVVKIRVQDDDGLFSQWKACSLYVKPGVPAINTITIDPSGIMYVRDSIKVSVSVSDSNNRIKSVGISWMNDGKFSPMTEAVGNIYELNKKFEINDSLIDSIRIRVTDMTDFSKDSLYPLVVLSGRPKVDSVKVVTVTGSNFFVKDNNTFRVYVSDNNGTPKKMYAAWNNEPAPTDSLTINGTSSFGEFTHWYDTSMSGTRTVRFWVDDNDSLRSAAKDTTILVRMGAPAVWGDNGDTVWVVVKNGPGNYYYKVNYKDTNGTVDTFYYSASNNFSSATALYRVDSAMITISEDLCNSYLGARYVWVKDDDGLISSGKFFVSADSAPPEPLGLYVLSTDNGDSVQIQWDSTALDKKDNLATEIKISIHYGNTGDPDIVLMDWTAAHLLRTTGTKRYFKFKKSYTGDIRYRIHLRDLRGTESASGVSTATIN